MYRGGLIVFSFFVHLLMLKCTSYFSELALVAQLDARLTGDQENAGLNPASLATFFRGDLIMKYFLLSFSPFR